MPRLETLTERPSEHKAMPDEQFETWLANEETVLRGVLERISPAELANIKLMWRGMNGEDIFDFLEGKAPSIHLDSYRPNATTDPHKAISYIGDSRLSFNCAIGFMTNEDRMKVDSALNVIKQDVPEEAMEYQKGNFIVNGDIAPEDARYIIIRPHGKKPGEVGAEIIYRINSKKIPRQKDGYRENYRAAA